MKLIKRLQEKRDLTCHHHSEIAEQEKDHCVKLKFEQGGIVIQKTCKPQCSSCPAYQRVSTRSVCHKLVHC